KDDPSLSQILGDRLVLAYRQPPNLKQILTSNPTTKTLTQERILATKPDANSVYISIKVTPS
uniref:hypothetical protein n=1 Tax=Leadbetterella sp. DM7 TaxID=3235085 RepID=UPI00349EB5E9